MAIEGILVKDSDGVARLILADKIGAGEEYAQVLKIGYGADGALTLLDEKPSTAAAQDTANAALGAPADAEAGGTSDGSIVGLLKRARTLLGNIASLLAGTLNVGGTVAISNLPATQPVSGTVAVSNFPGTQPVSGPLTDTQLRAAPVPTVENATVYTGAAAQTAVVNNILESVAGAGWTDVRNLRAASVQVVSTGTGGTFIFEQSNDGVNAATLPVFNAAQVTAAPTTAAITATASQIVYSFPIRCNFVRLRIVSAITGGSIQAFSRFSSEPWTAAAQLVASNTAANFNATIAAIPAGANLIGDLGVQYRANATGAGTPANVNSPATPAAQSLKASAGKIVSYDLANVSASARYVKVFNTAAAVTMGTTAAAFEIAIPAGQSKTIGPAGGIAMTAGIQIAVTGGRGLTDNTAITLGDVVGHIETA
ncbi:MAG: hypothetical protein O9320_08815 [Magnetospirillum sp.]|nr:hypothetical protein [Magnetospirillum sp.]